MTMSCHRRQRDGVAGLRASRSGRVQADLLIDHDIVRDINLNRILYATRWKRDHGVPKVEVLRRGIEALGLGCQVEPIRGSVLDDDTLRRVLDADLVFGCVDRAFPRYLLCELSARYLLPYIDVVRKLAATKTGSSRLIAA